MSHVTYSKKIISKPFQLMLVYIHIRLPAIVVGYSYIIFSNIIIHKTKYLLASLYSLDPQHNLVCI
jgi:hypothetical protein